MGTPPEINYDIVSQIIFSSVDKYPDKTAICDQKKALVTDILDQVLKR